MPGMRFYRLVSGVLCASFAVVGFLFLLIPDVVLALFDGWSRRLGLATSPGPVDPFFPVLAVAYMVVVTVLAWGMLRDPRDEAAPRRLVQAKMASAALSLGVFFLRQPALILLVNAIVDGSIGAVVLLLRRSVHGAAPERSA